MTTTAVELLVHRLMLHSAQHREHVTGQLLDSLANQLADREAELAAIRHAINEMMAGPYAPSERAIVNAVFWPSKALVARLRKPAITETANAGGDLEW